MSKHLTKQFIDLGRLSLTAETFPEARLDHAESRLAVASLVIMPHVLFAVIAVQMKDAIPRLALRIAARVRAKRHVRLAAETLNQAQIRPRGISFVATDFPQTKVLGRLCNQRLEVISVVRIAVGDFNRRDYMSTHADHRVQFPPIVRLLLRVPVLLTVPTNKVTGREAGAINGEVNFDGLQRHSRLRDEVAQERCQSFIFKIVTNGIEVRRLFDVALLQSISQVGGKAA